MIAQARQLAFGRFAGDRVVKLALSIPSDGSRSDTSMDQLIYHLEVDVSRERPPTPRNIRTHYVTVSVDDRPNLTSADNEARNLAAWMVWHVRGPMVTAVRIVEVEL